MRLAQRSVLMVALLLLACSGSKTPPAEDFLRQTDLSSFRGAGNSKVLRNGEQPLSDSGAFRVTIATVARGQTFETRRQGALLGFHVMSGVGMATVGQRQLPIKLDQFVTFPAERKVAFEAKEPLRLLLFYGPRS